MQTTSQPGKQPAAAAPEEPFIWHTVTPRDTLLGLSLVYKLPVNTILQANDLPSSGNLALVPKLRIPTGRAPLATAPDAEASKRAKVREFRARNGLPEEEAKYYLLEAEWDLEKAQGILKGHLTFEGSAGGFDPASVQVFPLSSAPAAAAAAAGVGAAGRGSAASAATAKAAAALNARGAGGAGGHESGEEGEGGEAEAKPLVGGRGAGMGTLRRRKAEGGE